MAPHIALAPFRPLAAQGATTLWRRVVTRQGGDRTEPSRVKIVEEWATKLRYIERRWGITRFAVRRPAIDAIAGVLNAY
jgi:hypothetical protein